jgi:uncharacterized membrane protein YedE/YeeE
MESNSEGTKTTVGWKPRTGLIALLSAIVIFFLLHPTLPRLALFWVLGLLVGFVLQRSRFCFVSAVSNFALFRDSRLIEGILGGIVLATVGFALVMHAEVPDPSSGVIPATAFVSPFGWHLVLAGVIFGIGMLLAGGCILSNLYRIGEGAVSSLVAFVGILIGFGVLQHNYPWWWNNYISTLPQVWLPAYLGWVGAVTVTLGLLLGVYLLVRRFRAHPASAEGNRLEVKSGFRKIDARIGVHAFLVKAWPLALGGTILGLLNVLAYWQLQRPWGISGEIMRWAQLIQSAVHLPAPPTTTVPGT